jgi:hypothetical protein
VKTSSFALVFGVLSLVLGLAGLVPAALVPPPADAPPLHFTWLYGYLFGLLPVNLLHTGARLALAAWGIAAWRGLADPGRYARAVAVFYGMLAFAGLLAGSTTLFGVLPVHGYDVWLHLASAAFAAYFGWRDAAELHAERRRGAARDRRQRIALVARDRRIGVGDRRIPHGDMQLGF